jgi:hypothetical protein
MEENNNILNQLKKSSKPDVPKDFFDNFSTNLMSKIDESESFLENLPKNNKPEVPLNFFDDFKVDIKANQSNRTKVFKLKIWHVVSTAAAIFIGIFLLNQNSQDQNIIAASDVIETETTLIVNDDQLAYIDESTLIDFIVSNNLTIDESSDEVSDAIYDEIGYGLDDYYYYD